MKTETSNDHINAYERAVCYYTLPKMATPVTYGLVAAYAICVLESVSAFSYGLFSANQTWTIAGAAAFAGIVIFGMIAFTIQALVNDWRKRATLAVAHNAPDAAETDDIPDPFSDHILAQRPAHPSAEVYACVTNEGVIEYYVEVRRDETHWRIRTPQDQALFDILAEHDVMPVGIFRTPPVRLGVYTEKKKVAVIVRRNTLRTAIVDIYTLVPMETQYMIKAGCIYFSGRLVGRIYDLRDNIYLDIEKEYATSGILAHFMTAK